MLLTGATGLLGSRVLPLLAGHDVLCLARRPAAVPLQPGIRAIAADLGSDGQWMDAVTQFGPEWCVHLAWEGLPDYSLDRSRANLDSSLRLLSVMARSGVKRVVVAGSCWEYGRVSGPISEDRQPVDYGVFAATKLALLTVLDSLARESAFEYRWARIFFAYGPGQRSSSLIPHLRAAYLAGRQPELRQPDAVQDFVHVDDVAAALVALAGADAPSGVVNVGSGEPTSVAYVADRVARHYGHESRYDGRHRGSGLWADTEKIFQTTGWRARIGIDEGIESTLNTLDQVR